MDSGHVQRVGRACACDPRRGWAHSYRLEPAPFHAANLALHLASTALVFYLVLCWLPERWGRRRLLAASLGALFFSAHPLQVEAVHWATALKDTLSGFLAIAALAFVPTAPKKAGLGMPLAWLLFGLALAAKPSVVVLPALWLLFAVARDGRLGRWAWLHFAVLLALAGAVAGIARSAQPAASGGTAFSLIERMHVTLDSLGFYLGQMLIPRAFCPDYGRTPEWVLEQGLTVAFFGGCGYVALIGGALLLRRWRSACLLLVLPIAVGPVLGMLPFTHQKFSTVTDRYAYLAMLGPALLLARIVVLPRLGRAWPLALAALAFCGGLASRTGENWRDTDAMWENVLVVNPRSGSAWTNLGFQHDQAGRTAEAIEYYERAIEADPSNALAFNNIGNIHFRAGRQQDAYRAYQSARDANPQDLNARNNLGAIHHQRGELDRAVGLFTEVIAINDNFAPAHYNLGLVRSERGDSERAEKHFRAALEIDPGYLRARRTLARLVAAKGDDAEAREHFSRALARAQGEPEFAVEWALVLQAAGRGADDVREARVEAYRLGWREPTFLAQLGSGLLAAQRVDLAEMVLRDAIAEGSGRLVSRLDLARLFEAQDRWDDYRELMIETVRDFPFEPEPWHNLAVYHVGAERPDKARVALETALRLRPNFAPSLRLVKSLE